MSNSTVASRSQIWLKRLQGLRVEEVIFLIFMLPSIVITLKANFYFFSRPELRSVKIEGGLWRLAVTIPLMIAFYRHIWFGKAGPKFRFIRDIAPFIFAISIYTNLHDTIHFVNAHDVHDKLIAIDQWLFGVQPCVWAEQFYHPWLTDWFSLNYMNYFWITVVLVLYLYFKKRYRAFRTVMLTMILSYYVGYILYIIFPAVPPRIVLANQFTIDIYRGTSLISTEAQRLVHISATSARGAFPSLHSAITFLTLAMAWRFTPRLFWALLPVGLSLLGATVYLRHHYVVDILAGALLIVITWFLTPVVDRWWHRLQLRWGVAPDVEPILGPGECENN